MTVSGLARRWAATPSLWVWQVVVALLCGALIGAPPLPGAWQALGSGFGLVGAAALAIATGLAHPRRSVGLMALVGAAHYLAAEHWAALAVTPTLEAVVLWRGLVLIILVGFEATVGALVWAGALWTLRILGTRPSGPSAGVHWAVAWSLSWWAADVLREAGWWGNGYGSLALAWLDVPGVLPWLAWIGATGTSALIAGLAAWAAVDLLGRSVGCFGANRSSLLAVPGMALALASVGTFGLGSSTRWTTPEASPLPITALQESVDKRARGWSAEVRDRGVQTLLAALRSTPRGGLVLAPETYFMAPVPEADAEGWKPLPDAARASGVHAIVGMPMLLRDERGVHLVNAAVHVAPERMAFYAKENPVPGAEYLPWPALTQPLMERLLGMSLLGQSPAPPALREPLYVEGQLVGASICHELAFADTMARRSASAQLLLNLADDNWIPSEAYRQRMLRIARARAAESGKHLVRVSNGMPTLVIDGDGRVTVPTTPIRAGLAQMSVAWRRGVTPYQASAEWQKGLPFGLWGVAALGAWVLQRRRSSGHIGPNASGSPT